MVTRLEQMMSVCVKGSSMLGGDELMWINSFLSGSIRVGPSL